MDDTKIIELFWARNEDAIAETDAAYGKKLRTLANRILGSREDAEESVSDTYMKTWETVPPQRPTYFYAFLASICRHLSFHRLDWKHAAKRHAEVVSLTDEMALCIPDTSHERELEGKEIGRLLNAFLADFPAAVLACRHHCGNRGALWHHGRQGQNAAQPHPRKAGFLSGKGGN